MKSPPRLPTLPRGLDLFSKYGAGILAAHIEAHWAARGERVKCERYELGANFPDMFGVRSNLVNGMPALSWGVVSRRPAIIKGVQVYDPREHEAR